MANAVMQQRAKMVPTPQVQFSAATNFVDFGPTDLNFTLQRWDNCTHGGPIDICSICMILHCEDDLALYSGWIENYPKFTAFAINIGTTRTIVATMPGEPLLDLGWWVRNDTALLDITYTFLAGYSNNHMGYFATPVEYDIGGYESQLTFWGIGTAEKIRESVKGVVTKVV